MLQSKEILFIKIFAHRIANTVNYIIYFYCFLARNLQLVMRMKGFILGRSVVNLSVFKYSVSRGLHVGLSKFL